jgi:hypothetical protein
MAAKRTHTAPPKAFVGMPADLRALSPVGSPNPVVTQIVAACAREHARRMSGGRPSSEGVVVEFVNGERSRSA